MDEKAWEGVGEWGTWDASENASVLALTSLRLRSASALLCLGGRNSFAMLRTWISEKEPEDCLMRGRRLRAFAGTLCDDCVAAGDSEVRADASGVACGIHSSERSSSHGCVMLAMLAWCCGLRGVGQAVVVIIIVRGRVAEDGVILWLHVAYCAVPRSQW